MLLLVAAILGALVLLAASVGFATRDDAGDDAVSATTVPGQDDASDPDPPEAPTSTSPPTTEPEPVSEEEFLALVVELEAYVAEARGLEFLRPVTVEMEGDEAFEARLLENFEEDVEEIEEAEVFYRAMGLIDPDTNLIDELRAIYSAGVLGFYDAETDELVVRGTSPTPYVQKTIVHELVHALDDQHFELHREQYDDRKDEIASGFSAVVEGNARRIETQWLNAQTEEFRQTANEQEQAFAGGIDIDAFPEILLFEIGAPYELGQVFVRQLVADGGERAVDAALGDPPTTSEQYLFPPVYVQREPRIEVPPPPADGEVVQDGVVGALFLFGLLTTGESTVDQADAFLAVQGWGGDWAVTWTEGDTACARIDLVGDTDQDTAEIERALTAWAEEQPAAVSTVDGRVRVDSCVPGAGSSPPQV